MVAATPCVPKVPFAIGLIGEGEPCIQVHQPAWHHPIAGTIRAIKRAVVRFIKLPDKADILFYGLSFSVDQFDAAMNGVDGRIRDHIPEHTIPSFKDVFGIKDQFAPSVIDLELILFHAGRIHIGSVIVVVTIVIWRKSIGQIKSSAIDGFGYDINGQTGRIVTVVGIKNKNAILNGGARAGHRIHAAGIVKTRCRRP